MRANIRKATAEDAKVIKNIFRTTLENEFKSEGLKIDHPMVKEEILEKEQFVDRELGNINSGYLVFVAELEGELVAIMSYGPVNQDTLNCLKKDKLDGYEIANAYVLPEFQNMGIAKSLRKEILSEMKSRNIKEYYLDSGFSRAQQVWKKVYGEPTFIAKDYWGKGIDNWIWKVNVEI